MNERRRTRQRTAWRRPAVSVAAALVVAVAAMAAGCSSTSSTKSVDDHVRLNQVQVVGTHNSYHQEANKAEEKLRGQFAPADEKTLEYDHPELPVQLDSQHVRQIELDVHLDDKGGLFAAPAIRRILKEGPLPYKATMERPGIKVFHIHDVDYWSRCPALSGCLGQLASWSRSHPDHVPIMVLLELTDTPVTQLPADLQATEEKWTPAGMKELDRTIRSVFPARDLITPDDVRGHYRTLEDAVRHGNWPTLGQSRGKVLFTMDNHEPYRSHYLQAFPDLKGAVLLPDADPPGPKVGPEPYRAFVEMNDPTGANQAIIRTLVQEGYVVRTRADADTVQARAGDTSMRDAALASGAQWVSTDYPVPGISRRFGTNYFVELPSRTTARCNPVNAPKACKGHDADLDPVKVTGQP